MKTYGLIGFPLGHSFSKAYFSEKFAKEGIAGVQYELFPIETIQQLPALLAAHPDCCGLNVTIPYKEAVLPYLHELSDNVRQIGACNCIAIRQGRLIGYNTDSIGFRVSLQKFLKQIPGLALVLGTGGASRAVQYVLRQMNIPLQLVSRTAAPGILAYEAVSPKLLSEARLIVNTTPLGMYPQVETCPPIPYDAIGPGHMLYDLVYNPAETQFMKEGRSRGAEVVNGYEMLRLQAEESWAIWNAPDR